MHSQLSVVLADKGHEVLTVAPEENVLEAIRRMNEKRVGALLVVVGHRPVGMFTERDVMARVLACNCNPADTTVAEVMTKKLAVVGPTTTVEEAMVICTEKRCRHLPVMEGDKLLGLISTGDLTRWVTRSQHHEIQNLVRYITGKYPA
jgi:CBS domain-containing protein